MKISFGDGDERTDLVLVKSGLWPRVMTWPHLERHFLYLALGSQPFLHKVVDDLLERSIGTLFLNAPDSQDHLIFQC